MAECTVPMGEPGGAESDTQRSVGGDQWVVVSGWWSVGGQTTAGAYKNYPPDQLTHHPITYSPTHPPTVDTDDPGCRDQTRATYQGGGRATAFLINGPLPSLERSNGIHLVKDIKNNILLKFCQS